MSWPPPDIPRGQGEVRLERNGPLALMVLSNPGARNAMSLGMMSDFLKATEALLNEPPLALIVTGDGGEGFCAGGDLKDVRAHLLKPGAAEAMSQAMGRATARLSTAPFVIVAAVEGAALGGGAELSQLADWVVMSDSAKIGFVHARLGVSPGWGGGRLLARRVGRSAATSVLLQAKVHRVEAAMALGLADQRSPEGGALRAAEDWLEPVLSLSPSAIRGLLEMIRAAYSVEHSAVERSVFCDLWGSPAHKAALDGTGAGQ